MDKERVISDEARCVDIQLNYACNAKCLFCSQDPSRRRASRDLAFETAVEQMYVAYRKGYRRLGFTGGEPTIRRDLAGLIALGRKIGYSYIRIQTNGLRLADPEYAASLARAGLNFVKFSIHGHNARMHDRLVGVPGAFARCLEAIRNLRELKIGMGVNIVLNRWNYGRLAEFYQLFLMKLQLSNFVIIAPLHEGSMAVHARRIGVRLTDTVPHIRRVYRMLGRIGYPKPPLLLHFTPCILPGREREMLGWSDFNTIVVSPAGAVHDLDAAAQSNTVKPESCRRCVYDARCIGMDRAYVERFGAGELIPLITPPRPARVFPARQSQRRRVLTDNEQCVLEVLRIQSPATTQEFLRIAVGIPLCRDCKDENAVISAGETLVRLGAVQRKFENGRYLWSAV